MTIFLQTARRKRPPGDGMGNNMRHGVTLTLVRWLAASRIGLLLLIVPHPVCAETLELFGQVAIPVPANPDLHPFTKWNEMIQRMDRERGWESADCTVRLSSCPQETWRKLLSETARQPKIEQMATVNRLINNIEYVSDKINWSGIDYWETPREFFFKGGECKDFAITKYFALRTLGWPVDAMWMIVLYDMNLNATHAILAVKYDGRTFILDNQISDIVEEGRIHHYRPIFGLDESGWVLFRPR
jgi:predicted transglutaminase-like cysteine proteinase